MLCFRALPDNTCSMPGTWVNVMLYPVAPFNLMRKTYLEIMAIECYTTVRKVNGKYCGSWDKEEQTVWRGESFAEKVTHLGIWRIDSAEWSAIRHWQTCLFHLLKGTCSVSNSFLPEKKSPSSNLITVTYLSKGLPSHSQWFYSTWGGLSEEERHPD